jgi:hypothetical protein
MQHRRPQHPSGRPIRHRSVKSLGFIRRPYDEPLTPGMQRRQAASAIGFTARLTDDEERPRGGRKRD